VLSLPYVLALNGWVLGLCFILLGAIAAVWSNLILARLASDLEVPNLSKLVQKAGGKGLERLLSYMVLFFMFGALISYQIIIT
jgi:amino acid permease